MGTRQKTSPCDGCKPAAAHWKRSRRPKAGRRLFGTPATAEGRPPLGV